MVRRSRPTDPTAAERQRRRRAGLAKAGYQQISLNLPVKLLRRLDAEARKRGAGRDQIFAELVAAMGAAKPVAPSSTPMDTIWLADLVGALAAMTEALGIPKTKPAAESVRAAHQKADRSYKTLPSELCATEVAKKLSYWLGRMDVLLGADAHPASSGSKVATKVLELSRDRALHAGLDPDS